MPRVVPTPWDRLVHRGRLASLAGQQRVECPFPLESAEALCWLAGFNRVTVSRETRDEWSESDLLRLKTLVTAGVPGRLVAIILNRSHGALRGKICRMRRDEEKVAA